MSYADVSEVKTGINPNQVDLPESVGTINGRDVKWLSAREKVALAFLVTIIGAILFFIGGLSLLANQGSMIHIMSNSAAGGILGGGLGLFVGGITSFSFLAFGHKQPPPEE